MEANNTVHITFSSYVFGFGGIPHPRDYLKKWTGGSFEIKSHAWIPQTVGDQIWIFIEFDNEEKKQLFLNALPPEIKHCSPACVDENPSQRFIDYWVD